ncbi:Multidrug efflux pump subunit AcrA (membrane-fusion protein) [Amycolatopsis xylanica]|uniref:Multidrug efflux pump subunit AcrA (Membrane-fusion protein) n=1 Tax=Amycolatopsis xylanica TaxID=589385 RepID=A0A1H2US66_9PSEU|nr:efflux RND transporter periplasmic adaptor subunit [Amycolatopsis xylanica]SDW58394.1 Multidrug efflux pump subunit AcrA (membrane-fusion protein) [Amycolatopsis xylanica]
MVKWKWALAAGVVLALVAGGFVVIAHGESKAPAASPPASVKTVAIEQTDLTDSRTFTGTLGFGTPQTLKGAGEGIVTKLPKPGDTAARGESFYAVNGKPVPVFYGDTPLFRTLDNPELTGTDVAMVADNLAALGYKVGTRPKDRAKTAYTATLSEAVKKWQKKAGLDDTGTLGVGQLVVLPGKTRVNTVSAVLGDPAAGPLMTVTPTDKVITVPVEAGSVAAIKAGAEVTIVRPDAKEIPGKVTAVSTTVEDSKDQQQQGPPKISITVTPDDEGAVADLDSASVQVQITMESHAGVLAVPVGALLALREGGYAVQLPDGTLKAVKTGMFSRDKVEISGAGIAAGMLVVTAS